MKILLTGGTGLVGKSFLASEKSLDYKIVAPSSSELNLLDLCKTHDFMESCKPDIIIHAAGKVGGIQANIADPVEFYYQNIQIGNNLISSALRAGVKKLINLGSSCMYPKDQDKPLKEAQILSSPLESTNEGYALAKIAIQRYCIYITKQYPEFNYKTLIPCNLYGEFDKFSPSSSHLIASIISKIDSAIIKEQDYVEIWGDGSARREFMYAKDLADALYFSIENFDKLPSTMNIGFGKDYTITEYYETVAQVMGYQGSFQYNHSRPVGMKRKLLDTSLQYSLGWMPITSLEQGIELTHNFYKSTK